MSPDPSSTPPGGRFDRRPTVSDAKPITTSAELDALLEDPRAGERLRALPSVHLHRLICSLGVSDSSELLALVAPQQVRDLLDLELWQQDRLILEEALDWLHLLTTLPEEVRFAHLRALDIELKGLVLKRYLRIYLLQEDEIPEDPAGVVHTTPDGWFALEILATDNVTAERLVELLDNLYVDDPDTTRRLLQNLMWEIPSELEELAYRWRCGRLQDLGFADPQESLLIYAYLDPRSIHPEEQTSDRGLVADPEPIFDLQSIQSRSQLLVRRFDGTSFWSRGLARVENPDEQRRLEQALLQLSNRCLSADRIEPADLEAAGQSLEGLQWRLSLGLEHLCDGDPDRAPAVLANVAMLRIARLGFSLTLDLRRQIATAIRLGRFGRKPRTADLLDPPLQQQISFLFTPRPQFYVADLGRPRSFHTVAELTLAGRWIDKALATAELIGGLVVAPDLADHATWGDLFRTIVVNGLLQRQGPLDRDSLASFLRQFADGGKLTQDVLQAAKEVLPTSANPLDHEVVEEWIEGLEQAVASLQPDVLDLRFVDGLVLEK